MGSVKATASSLPAFLATFLLLSSATATDFCDTADDKVLCSKMINGATTWPEAMTNALQATKKTAEAGQNIPNEVLSQLPASEAQISKESISKTCHESYVNILDNLQSCIGFVTKDPHESMTSFLSSISFNDCTGGLVESGLASDVATQYGSEITKMCGVLLALSEKKPSGN